MAEERLRITLEMTRAEIEDTASALHSDAQRFRMYADNTDPADASDEDLRPYYEAAARFEALAFRLFDLIGMVRR